MENRYKEDEKEADRRQRKYKIQVCSSSQQSNGLTEWCKSEL